MNSRKSIIFFNHFKAKTSTVLRILSFGSYDDFLTHFQSFKTWYLVDDIISFKLVLVKTVVALSPKGVVKDEFQEFDKDLVQKFYMPPWLLENFIERYNRTLGLLEDYFVTQQATPRLKEFLKGI